MGIPLEWDVFREYLRWKRNRKEEDLNKCGKVFHEIKEFFKDKELTEESVFSFFSYRREVRKNKDSTINNYIKFLHLIGRKLKIQWLRDIDYIPLGKVIRDVCTVEEERQIINCKPHTYKSALYLNEVRGAAIELMFVTGMRRSEICNLTYENLQGNWVYIRGGKGKKDRVVYITDHLVKKISALPHFNHNFVFGSTFGRMFENGLYEEMRLRLKMCGINKKIGCHGARRSFATEMMDKDVPISAVAEVMGHEDVKTTQTYQQVSGRLKRRVAQNVGLNVEDINLDYAYERAKKLMEELMPRFKVEIKRSARGGIRLAIDD